MASNTETSVSNLKINRLTQTQLENASSLSNTEAYWVDPEFTGDKILVTDSNGDIVEGNTAVIDGSLGMPSSTYDDLTLGATGSTYTAPANGWFYINKGGTNGSQYVYMHTTTRGMCLNNMANSNAIFLFPVLKNDVVTVDYTASGTTNNFRFIYAEADV